MRDRRTSSFEREAGLSRREVLAGGAAFAAMPKRFMLGMGGEVKAASSTRLWYEAPAREWIEALPLGNGRLGAMVFGDVLHERIGLNEDTLWSGSPYDPAVDVAPEILAEIRRLTFAGDLSEAQSLANRLQGKPSMQASYQTVGELRLDFDGLGAATGYRRELDLDAAIATVDFEAEGVRYRREMFVSPVDQGIVIRLTADKPGRITFAARFETPLAAEASTVGQGVAIRGRNGDSTTRDGKTVLAKAGLTFQAGVEAHAQGGAISVRDGRLAVEGADSVTLIVVVATSYVRYDDVSGDPAARCEACLAPLRHKPYDRMKRDHLAAHRRLFRRVSLDLGHSAQDAKPTDVRIGEAGRLDDPDLAALYFQFGRYLLMSASRPGGQPANLQGIWNQDLMAPWDGKYTININTEMNYWPAQVGNLPECEEPLFRLVSEIAKTGARTAKALYGARGWVCHHNTDLWRATAPIDGAFWGQWQTGGAWLCNALFQSYLFEGSRDYLTRLYPILKGSARFFLDTLVPEPTHGWLVTCPSNSPEHERVPGLTNSPGPTMDTQILRELFANIERSCAVLGSDREFAAECRTARERLAPNQVGRHGQLQEWLDDIDGEVPEIEHRHMSPLYGLYPGSEITPDSPVLFAAARRLTEMRAGLGTEGMGWAVAWRINLWARLGDAERAHAFLRYLLSAKTEKNLFDKPSVQLDGNFGGCAGIAEMLLQSHRGEVHLLPSLPVAWSTGSFKGLRARGGFTVDAQWRRGRLESATVHSRHAATCRIRYGEQVTSREIAADARLRVRFRERPSGA